MGDLLNLISLGVICLGYLLLKKISNDGYVGRDEPENGFQIIKTRGGFYTKITDRDKYSKYINRRANELFNIKK